MSFAHRIAVVSSSQKIAAASALMFSALLLGAGSVPGCARAGGLDDLHHFVATFQSARGSFTQTVTAPSKKVTTSTGDFVFARPGKFRWTYQKPYNQVLVADGKNLTVQ